MYVKLHVYTVYKHNETKSKRYNVDYTQSNNMFMANISIKYLAKNGLFTPNISFLHKT